MDFISLRVNELLKRSSPIKRWIINKVAYKYYKAGYLDGQKLIYKTTLRGEVLKKFIEILSYCGIKFSYNMRKGGLIISVHPSKISNLENFIKNYEQIKKDNKT